jgi:dTDP-4-amino-4,6-dideoxygalactose transaminase
MFQAGVPFADLSAVNDPIAADLRRAFERVLAGGAFTSGPEVERFESAFATRVGVPYAVGVGSGTAALQLALQAAGIDPGDEVILPPNTYFATAEAVLAAGARPVFADVDLETALIDPGSVRAAIGPRTAAIMAVHLYGQPADMDALGELAARKGLLLLEDAAQAVGAEWRGRPAGSFGAAAGFSFYPSKNLGALGDAGAVTTADAELARKVSLLRNHGQQAKYLHLCAGFNHRMDELQAAFLSAKLPYLAAAQRLRDRAAARYRALLGSLEQVTLLSIAPEARHVHHLMVIRVQNRDETVAVMRAAAVDVSIHYPRPIHLEPAWQGGRRGQFPNAEALADSVLSLPLFPGITDAQIDTCVGTLTTACARPARTPALPIPVR